MGRQELTGNYFLLSLNSPGGCGSRNFLGGCANILIVAVRLSLATTTTTGTIGIGTRAISLAFVCIHMYLTDSFRGLEEKEEESEFRDKKEVLLM